MSYTLAFLKVGEKIIRGNIIFGILIFNGATAWHTLNPFRTFDHRIIRPRVTTKNDLL